MIVAGWITQSCHWGEAVYIEECLALVGEDEPASNAKVGMDARLVQKDAVSIPAEPRLFASVASLSC